MPVDSAQALKINLAKWKCSSLNITTEVMLSEDIIKVLNLKTKGRYTHFFEEYTRNGIVHSMVLRFIRYLRQPDKYAIRIKYEALGTKEESSAWFRGSKMERKPSQEFLKLCDIKDSLSFRCECSFSYSKEDKGVFFALPIQVDDKLYDEIRGLRFVKLQEDKILWETYVDLVASDRMIHTIRLLLEDKFRVDLPKELLKKARAISLRT